MKRWYIRFKRRAIDVPMRVEFFTIHTLMLADFIDIVCDKKLYKVVKSGKPTEAEIVDHWDKLFIEYCDMIGDTEYESAIDGEKELNRLNAQINLVSSALKILMNVYVADLARFISDEYAIIVEYNEDADIYGKQFLGIEGRVKKWQTDYDILYLQRTPASTEDKPLNRDVFTRLRIELSEFMGFPVQEHVSFTSEFAIMINKLSAHNKALESKHKKLAA